MKLIAAMFLMLTVFSSAGCTPPLSTHYRRLPTTFANGPSEGTTERFRVRVYFATNRDIARTSSAEPFYSDVPATNPAMHFGAVDVSIPNLEPLGGNKTELPFHRGTKVSSGVKVKQPVRWKDDGGKSVDVTTFAKKLKAEVGRRDVVVYVHGNANTFVDASKRAARLNHDLGMSYVPVIFTWPVDEPFATYPRNENQIHPSSRYLLQALRMLRWQLGKSAKIHLVAHSLGARVTLRALERAGDDDEGLLNHVVLAAPDIDARDAHDLFRFDGKPLLKRFDDMTVYICERDLPLMASMHLHGPFTQTRQRPRLGQAGWRTRVIDAAKIAFVDASLVEFSEQFHAYAFTNPRVISDLFLLLVHDAPAEKRNLLKAVDKQDRTVWLVRR